MALMLSELRADDDHATKAAEEVAGYQRAFNELKLEIAALRGDVQTGVERMAGEVKATNRWLSVVGAVLLLLIGSQGALWIESGKLDGQLSGLRSETGDVRAQLAQISAQLAGLPR
jgi:hypothetical protein